jgi:hypothetical protein
MTESFVNLERLLGVRSGWGRNPTLRGLMPESAKSHVKRREAVLCAWQNKAFRSFTPKRSSQTRVFDAVLPIE